MRSSLPTIETSDEFKQAINGILTSIVKSTDDKHATKPGYEDIKSFYIQMINDFKECETPDGKSLILRKVQLVLDMLMRLNTIHFKPALIKSIEWSHACTLLPFTIDELAHGHILHTTHDIIVITLVAYEIDAYKSLIQGEAAILSHQSCLNLVNFRVQQLRFMKIRIESGFSRGQEYFAAGPIFLLNPVLDSLKKFLDYLNENKTLYEGFNEISLGTNITFFQLPKELVSLVRGYAYDWQDEEKMSAGCTPK